MPPRKPGAAEGNGNEELMTAVRRVVEYTGLDINGALELPSDMFMLCAKNREIEMLMQTQEGREYLEDCERYKQTKPDMKALRRLQAELG